MYLWYSKDRELNLYISPGGIVAQINMDDLTARERYWLITGSVGPRPIALITSLDSDGSCNTAPFSAFNYISETPPLMAVGIDRYGDESHRISEQKDTLDNIVNIGEFVVNMVDEETLERAVRCATDFPKSIQEHEAVGLQLVDSSCVQVPRIRECTISWECRLFKLLDLSGERSLVLGEIVSMYFHDELIDLEKMRVRIDRFFPIGRLGGPNYCRTGDRLTVPVPPFNKDGKPRV